MVEEKKNERVREIEFDPKELRKSTCHIRRFLDGKVAICKGDDGKIRLYEVEKEE